ncbi:MAG: transposase [Thermodesulfobacteriota bacterium]|nr:transposase [Thermodesulfobacteriota bacterium]
MARANRHFIPGHAWHITHRCHKREFLLKFTQDRRCWLRWLFEARKRYNLSILNYCVTSNHIHLLVVDSGSNIIPQSMQLIAGRTAQEYNRRKKRLGAFWEDRYHATAVQKNHHLVRCMIYIDLNMVRAGVVDHPSQWLHCGYNEIINPPQRYHLIDRNTLMQILNIPSETALINTYKDWIDASLIATGRESCWSRTVAVGSAEYVSQIKKELGIKAQGRSVRKNNQMHELREPLHTYNP